MMEALEPFTCCCILIKTLGIGPPLAPPPAGLQTQVGVAQMCKWSLSEWTEPFFLRLAFCMRGPCQIKGWTAGSQLSGDPQGSVPGAANNGANET